MATIHLSRALIRRHADPQSFERGEQYAQSGAVRTLRQRGEVLEADVEGSQYRPYRVRVTLDAAGVVEATCTCPYVWGGWCKHIVATLLAALSAPDEIEVRPALAAQVEALDEAQRTALLHALAGDPDLADALERHLRALALQQGQSQVQAGRRASVDKEAFRKHLRYLLRDSGYDSYYEEGSSISLTEPLTQIGGFVAGGDSANALALLDVLTDELTEAVDRQTLLPEGIEWPELDEAWCAALLAEPLSTAERKGWAKKLLRWCGKLDDYGWDAALAGAQLTAEQGWEGPLLRAWREGQTLEEADQEDEMALAAVAEALLATLERRGDDEGFLRVARATGAGQRYLLKLIALGRSAQAQEEAAAWLTSPDEALTVAQVLRAAANPEGALHVAEQWLTLNSVRGESRHGSEMSDVTAAGCYRLAAWLAELALGMGRGAVALRATEAAFRAQPTVQGYEQMQALAGDAWGTHYRSALLTLLRQSTFYHTAEAASEIFIREGLLDDAMGVAERSHNKAVLRRVMAAVVGTHPGWVIERARQQAEPIMDKGQSSHYHEAVAWLTLARDAYHAADRKSEWPQYRAVLNATHGRKHKLMRLMKGL